MRLKRAEIKIVEEDERDNLDKIGGKEVDLTTA